MDSPSAGRTLCHVAVVTTVEIIGFAVTLLVMVLGLVGAVLPGLPGTPVLFFAALVHRLVFPESGAPWLVVVALGLLAVLSLAVDYVATMYGARKLGATSRGMIGAIVGGIIGLFFNLPGILLGPFLGATVFELSGRRPVGDCARAGLGATIGLLAGSVGKVLICCAMILLFTVAVLWRVFA